MPAIKLTLSEMLSYYSKLDTLPNPISRKVKLQTVNHCFVVCTKNNNKIEFFCSGIKKFHGSVGITGKKNKVLMKIITKKGTEGDEAKKIMDEFIKILRNERNNSHYAWAKGFSIRKNKLNESDKNFKTAIACGYFHKEFYRFCKSNNFYCHYQKV